MKRTIRKKPRRREILPPKATSPHTHYKRALRLELSDAASARAAYEACLNGDCSHLEARINLGRLLHAEGLLSEAEALYRAAAEPSALLLFNLGVLLEDLKRELDAIQAYRSEERRVGKECA